MVADEVQGVGRDGLGGDEAFGGFARCRGIVIGGALRGASRVGLLPRIPLGCLYSRPPMAFVPELPANAWYGQWVDFVMVKRWLAFENGISGGEG